MDLFDLVAKITLDSSEYEKGLKDASGSAEGFGSKFGGVMKASVATVAALAAAVAGISTAMVAAIGKTAEYGDNVDKMSQKMGLSAEAYQEWDAILQHSGTSIDSMSRGMVTLSRQAENNSAAFEKLGITQQELATMNQEELFARTIEGLQGMEAGTERTALAQELLGGSAKELGALLNTSAEDTEAMRKRVHELGGVMSDDAVKAAAAYQDSLQDMKTALSGASRGITAEFLPSVTLVMDGLTAIFSGGDGLGKITQGINDFVKKLSSALPKIMSVGGQILNSLTQAIIANLPMLVESAVQLIMTLAEGLIQNLPMLMESALQIILALADGISESLPELIPTIVDVILQIVDSLIDNVDKLLGAALQIIIALATGLIAALPQLLAKAPEIISSLVNAIIGAVGQLLTAAGEIISTLATGIANGFASLVTKGQELVSKVGEGFSNAVSSALSWGKDLVQNFIDGILAKWESLKQTVKDVANSVKDFLGFSEPKEGPLSNFHTYAPDMMMLFAKGVRDNKKMLQDTVADAFDFQDLTVSPTANVYANNNGNGFEGYGINGNVYITVEGAGKNAEEIGRELYQMLNRKVGAYAY